MKILQVISYFNPKFGGDVNVVFNLSKHLAKKGHEVTILTTDFDFDIKYANVIRYEDVKVIPFHCMLNWGLFLYSPSMKSWIKENIKRFDIVHMHNFRSYQNSVIYYYARKYNVQYILQAHGSVLPFFSKIRLKKMYDFIWGYKILKNASKCIALTKTEEEKYKKMGVKPNKIEIVPNGIDLHDYENLPKKGTFRKKYRINDNEKIVLYVGRLHESKGIDLLVRSFSDILKKLSNIRLVIVGPDEGFKSKLIELTEILDIKDKVLFSGFVSHPEKIDILMDSDVFITPRFSGFPITFLEALACGIPIITTNNGDKLDWINDKVGYVIDYDENELNATIYKILEDYKLQKNFKTNARMLLEHKFNYDVIIEGLEKIYNDCVKI